jgi:glycosyltransferase involved in cell wall biosynthesis
MDKSLGAPSSLARSGGQRPRLVVVSAAWPFPGIAGQQQRVRNKLLAWRNHFHLSFVTFAPGEHVSDVEERLREWVDEPLVLPSRYSRSHLTRLVYRFKGLLFSLRTGLKFSNYIIGQVELTPQRLALRLDSQDVDLALFEYWHSVNAVSYFRQRNIPTVLDMHDLLWQSFDQYLTRWYIPHSLRHWAVRRYRRCEEAAWQAYDALIAINRAEYDAVHKLMPQKPLLYAPMGIDLQHWPYSWQPEFPPKIAYYGSLGSLRNQEGAWRVCQNVMPAVWQSYPQAELWIIGNNPSAEIEALPASDSRLHVTGFVPDVKKILQRMTMVVCPWEGRFGFRSRFVEVMALGVPVVTTPDAVHGMGFEPGQGLYLGNDDEALSAHVLALLADPDRLAQASSLARRQVEEQFSFDETYGRLSREMIAWLNGSI